jgi:hypothetical protein
MPESCGVKATIDDDAARPILDVDGIALTDVENPYDKVESKRIYCGGREGWLRPYCIRRAQESDRRRAGER